MQWNTLYACYLQNGSKLPMTVVWSSFGGEQTITLKEVFRPDSDRAEWGYMDKAIRRIIFSSDANDNNFKLKKLLCKCDFRNVILVTGCRCGKGYE